MRLLPIEGLRALSGAAVIVIPCALLAATTIQTGQANPQDKKEPPVLTVNVKQEQTMPGWKTAVLQGRTDSNGYRFVVPSLDVLQPVGVMLVAPGGDEMKLELFKDGFDKPLKTASTTNRGGAHLEARTMGALQIKVSSSEGVKPYQLIVMVGNEIKVPVPSLYVPISMAGAAATTNVATSRTDGPASSGSGGNSMVMWVIAIALVLIAAMLAFILMRRNKSKAASILLAIVIPGAALSALKAQGTLSPEAQGYDPTAPVPVPIKEVVSKEATEWLEWIVKRQSDQAKAILELFDALTAKDKALEPKYAGMPGIPTACVSAIPKGTATAIGDVDWEGPCGECFAEAHDSVATTLMRFEKLRRVNAQTKEIYDKSIAFGDGAAPVGGIITAGEWMKIRKGISENMDRYYVTYDDKVEELSATLVSSLKKVAACEAKFFNNPSWYDRYGFMFVTPIVERHRR